MMSTNTPKMSFDSLEKVHCSEQVLRSSFVRERHKASCTFAWFQEAQKS